MSQIKGRIFHPGEDTSLEAYFCDNGDLEFGGSWEDLEALRSLGQVQIPLYVSDDEHTGKYARIAYDQNLVDTPVSARFVPTNAGWNDMEGVEIRIGPKGMQEVDQTGKSFEQIDDSRNFVYVRDKNSV